MRRLLFLFILTAVSLLSFSQFTYKIKADSVRLYNDSCNAELIIENATRNVNGFLYNKGNGRTEFRKPMVKVNDSIYLFGEDTLRLNGGGSTSGNYILNQNTVGQTGNFWINGTGTIDNKLLINTTDQGDYKLQVLGSINLESNFRGSRSLAIGTNGTLQSNTGLYNIAIGRLNLTAHTSGNGNIAIGDRVMQTENSGSARNFGIGTQALQAIVAGNDNIGIGTWALDWATTAYNNTALGSGAGEVLRTGNNNIYLGAFAGNTLANLYDTQNNNIIIGAYAQGTSVPITNTTVIGTSLSTSLSNVFLLGRSDQDILIGAPTVDAGDYKLQVSGNTINTGFIDITKQAAPGIPSAGYGRLYPKTDGKLYWKDDAGTEYDLTLVGGNSNTFSNGLTNTNGTIQLGDTAVGSGSHNFTANRYQYLNGYHYSIGGSKYNPVTRPVFRFYDNGDFSSNAINNYNDPTSNYQNGIRFNAKLGYLELGTGSYVDTSISNLYNGSQYRTSALIMNTEEPNYLTGQVIGSVLNAYNIQLPAANRIYHSTISGGSYFFSGTGRFANVVAAGGYNWVSGAIKSSVLAGTSQRLYNNDEGSVWSGFYNVNAAKTSRNVTGGSVNTMGSANQLTVGNYLVNRSFSATSIGNSNVDFTSLPFNDIDSIFGTAHNIQKNYLLFSLGNSNAKYGATRSNALTVLYDGRTQINTTGFDNNLTESDVTPKAALDIVSNNTGVLLPRLTTTQRNNIVSSDLHNGLLLYNTDSTSFEYYNGSLWKTFGSTANSGTTYNFSNGLINESGTIKLGGFINQPTIIETTNNFSIASESTTFSISPSSVYLNAANGLNQTQSGLSANGTTTTLFGELNLPNYPLTRNNGSASKFLTTDNSGNVQLRTVDLSSINSGISSLNTLTGSTQTFATGTTGTDFNISSSGTTHTFNIPDASTSNRGLVTTGTQTFAGTKSFAALATGGSAPTPSGTTKMVITDANGQLSFANTPSASATVISLHSDATANITLTNQQNSEQDLTNDTRTQRYGDLSGKTQARVICRIATASNSPNSPRLYLQYSTNGTTWQTIGQTTTPTISMSTTGIKDTGWFTITNSASADNTYFRVAQNGGNNNADPAIGYIEIWFK